MPKWGTKSQSEGRTQKVMPMSDCFKEDKILSRFKERVNNKKKKKYL